MEKLKLLILLFIIEVEILVIIELFQGSFTTRFIERTYPLYPNNPTSFELQALTDDRIEKGNCLIPYRKREDKPYLYDLKPNTSLVFTGCLVRLRGVNITTNSFGFRDKELPLEKRNSTIRIVFLGDSITFGWGIDYGKRFSEILVERLNEEVKDRGIQVEGINMGIPGYNTFQEVEIFLERGIKFKPDMVIILFLFNDLEDLEVKEKISKEVAMEVQSGRLKCPPEYCNIFQTLEVNRRFNNLAYSSIENERKFFVRNVIEPLYRLRANFAGPILIVMLPPVYPEQKEWLSEYVRNTTNTYLIDISSWWKGNLTLAGRLDGHPNEEGHKIIADVLHDKIWELGIFQNLAQKYLKNFSRK